MATKKASNSNKPPTKSEVFNQIASDTGLTRKEVGAVFESLGGMINKSLSSRGPGLFNVVGLMKIKVVKKPATKERKGSILLPAKKPSSKPSLPARWSRFSR